MKTDQVLLVTQHGKERFLAPVLADAGLVLHHHEADTDMLGTFSGERERPADALETLRLKARLAADIAKVQGIRWLLASEGSFGPHPEVPFLATNQEWLGLVNVETGHQVIGYAMSTSPNLGEFTGNAHTTKAELHRWWQQHSQVTSRYLPEYGQGFLLRWHDANGSLSVEKDLLCWEQVWESWLSRCQVASELTLMTDQRAHRNPPRREVIVAAANDLLARWRTACPVCEQPGFGLAETVPGLPCGWCSRPTRLPKAGVWLCGACGHKAEQPYIGPGQEVPPAFADPMYCDFCNA